MYSKIRLSKDESSTQPLRYHVDRLRLGAQPKRRVSALELRMRLRFNRMMRQKNSKTDDTTSQIKNKIEDDWIDWMLIWKAAAATGQNRGGGVEGHMEIDQQAFVHLRQAFFTRSERKESFLSPQEAVIRIQMCFRAYLRRKSQLLQAIRDLATVDSKLKMIRGLFKDSSYRVRWTRDIEENQRFAEKIIVLLLTVDAIEVANVKVRLAKKLMVDELESVLDKVDNRGRPSRNSMASIEDFSPSSSSCNKEEKGEKSTSVPVPSAGIRMEDLSDHPGAIFLRRAFTPRGVKNEKEKWLSPADAATKIQRSFRAYLVRKSRALQAHQDLAVVETKLKGIQGLFNDDSYRLRVAQDAEERQRFAEKIIVLLLTADAIEGLSVMIRGAKKSMVDDLEAMLDVVDPQPPAPPLSIRYG